MLNIEISKLIRRCENISNIEVKSEYRTADRTKIHSDTISVETEVYFIFAFLEYIKQFFVMMLNHFSRHKLYKSFSKVRNFGGIQGVSPLHAIWPVSNSVKRRLVDDFGVLLIFVA